MSIIKAEGVSIRYITGDFKEIGLKEYIVRHITRKYIRTMHGAFLCTYFQSKFYG